MRYHLIPGILSLRLRRLMMDGGAGQVQMALLVFFPQIMLKKYDEYCTLPSDILIIYK